MAFPSRKRHFQDKERHFVDEPHNQRVLWERRNTGHKAHGREKQKGFFRSLYIAQKDRGKRKGKLLPACPVETESYFGASRPAKTCPHKSIVMPAKLVPVKTGNGNLVQRHPC